VFHSNLNLYQVLFILLSILLILIVLNLYRIGKNSAHLSVLLIISAIILLVVSIYPNLTTYIANRLGFGRGLDLILILSIGFNYYLLFKLYKKIENLNQEISSLVTEVAILNENFEENNENKLK
jgi:hypothetical protein